MVKKLAFVSLALFFTVGSLNSFLVKEALAEVLPPISKLLKDPDGGEPWGHIEFDKSDLEGSTNMRSGTDPRLGCGAENGSSEKVVPANGSLVGIPSGLDSVDPERGSRRGVPPPHWRFYLIWLGQLFLR